MFKGPIGKRMMIRQGYVPDTCTLDDQLAGLLIWSEVNKGRDPCAGCTQDRKICGGRPPAEKHYALGVSDILTNREQQMLDDREDERRRARENPMPGPWEEIK